MISLFPHQQEALQETKDFDNIAVYHDMGLGKTFTGSEMMKRFGCKVNLIVCQKSKVQDWVEHFTDNYQMQVFDLTNKKQLGEYHGLSQGQRFFIVGVINYELAWRRKELLALLNNPKLLILDEPTNGLDPIGIEELRELIRSFPAKGITVILSSHILSEVQQTADHIGIIAGGVLGYEGKLNANENLEQLFMDVVKSNHREG